MTKSNTQEFSHKDTKTLRNEKFFVALSLCGIICKDAKT